MNLKELGYQPALALSEAEVLHVAKLFADQCLSGSSDGGARGVSSRSTKESHQRNHK